MSKELSPITVNGQERRAVLEGTAIDILRSLSDYTILGKTPRGYYEEIVAAYELGKTEQANIIRDALGDILKEIK